MYCIESTPYGFRITLSGELAPLEIDEWIERSRHAIGEQRKSFCLLFDARELAPLSVEVRTRLIRWLFQYQKGGLHRTAIIGTGNSGCMQLWRVGIQSGIFKDDLLLDASHVRDWEEAAAAWFQQGIKPSVEN
jgi:hypothetical protein